MRSYDDLCRCPDPQQMGLGPLLYTYGVEANMADSSCCCKRHALQITMYSRYPIFFTNILFCIYHLWSPQMTHQLKRKNNESLLHRSIIHLLHTCYYTNRICILKGSSHFTERTSSKLSGIYPTKENELQNVVRKATNKQYSQKLVWQYTVFSQF